MIDVEPSVEADVQLAPAVKGSGKRAPAIPQVSPEATMSKGKGKRNGKGPVPREQAGVLRNRKSGKTLTEILAERSASSSVGECSNTDVLRSSIREEESATLWLGNQEDAEDVAALRRDGITHILNCARDVPRPAHAEEFEYLHVSLRDAVDAAPDLKEELRKGEALNFIEAGLKRGGVLVHCRLGRSRSASFVVAFLASARGCTYAEALQEVKHKRQLYGGSLVDPNDGFKEVLTEFCEEHRPCNRGVGCSSGHSAKPGHAAKPTHSQ